MLLVNHDQANVVERREHGGAGTDADARFAGTQPQPLVMALALAEPGMEHRDDVAKAGLEATDGLRGERDLGNQHDRAPSGLERGLHRLEVDLGLARPGHAVEQESRARVRTGVGAASQRPQDGVERLALLGAQRGWRVEAPPDRHRRRPPHPGVPAKRHQAAPLEAAGGVVPERRRQPLSPRARAARASRAGGR